MVKRRHNWRARQIVETVIDNSVTKQIKLDLERSDGKYDESNELVLPSKKRKTRVKRSTLSECRILSKKQRKKLEKIVERKAKKLERNELLEALSKTQISNEEISKLTSISAIQTKGLKRLFVENQYGGAKSRVIVKRDVFIQPVDVTNDNSVKVIDDVPIVKSTPPVTVTTAKVVDIDVSPVKSVTCKVPAVYVTVHRDPEIQRAREKLPILAEEQHIMETIRENDIVLVAGETGSGKTTQLPQFLYEAGYCRDGRMIGITEPRRVAAMSMSQRVGVEMSLTSHVNYLIRYEGNVTTSTVIKFMTDGVLLTEIQRDFLLSQYSVIILDEAHERTVNTDILIGLLSRIVMLRQKRQNALKLIVMSATLRLTDFIDNRRLFKVTPPVVKIDSRQFPVTIHFNRRTSDNYVTEAYKKIVKIHNTLPDGGILVFLTGQQEVNYLVRKLKVTFGSSRHMSNNDKSPKVTDGKDKVSNVDDNPVQVTDDSNDSDFATKRKKSSAGRRTKRIPPRIDLDTYTPLVDDSSDDGSDISDSDLTRSRVDRNCQPLWVLPLYSLLSTERQRAVFEAPPSGHRLCVVATNVAETSLTIPRVRYVIDAGKCKVKMYDKVTGVSCHVIDWCSKSSANQRAGRAGRLGPGHCYRLYSSAVFNDLFAEHAQPEILRRPIDDLYLHMRCMNIEKVASFPFVTTPDMLQIQMAEKRLRILGALEECGGGVTDLGRIIEKFPVLPRYGKMLALSHQYGLLNYTVCLVAALSVPELLLSDEGGGDEAGRWRRMRHKWAGQGNARLLGDFMVLLRAVGGAEYANVHNQLITFCAQNGLRHKALMEIRKLRIQLTNQINVNDSKCTVDPKMTPPTDEQAKLLRQIVLSGLGDQLARRLDGATTKNCLYQANNMEEPVLMHAQCVLRRQLPEYVVYSEIYEAAGRMYMRGACAIESEWLPLFVPSLCNLSDPKTEPPPFYRNGRIYCTVEGTIGAQAWPLGHVTIEHPPTIDYYKLFVRHLLDGTIFPKLKRFTAVLLSPPMIMLKKWSKLQQHTTAILNALMQRQCHTKCQLSDIWHVQETSNYLFAEYVQWLPKSAHAQAKSMWPPLD